MLSSAGRGESSFKYRQTNLLGVSSIYLKPVSVHRATPSTDLQSTFPCRLIQPFWRLGLPIIRAQSGTSLMTTEPAAIKQYRPKLGATHHSGVGPPWWRRGGSRFSRKESGGSPGNADWLRSLARTKDQERHPPQLSRRCR